MWFSSMFVAADAANVHACRAMQSVMRGQNPP